MGSLFAPPPLPPPPPSTFDAYSHFNASMAIIIVVLVSAFFIMGFFSVYVKRCASSEYEAQLAHLRDPARMATVTRAEIGLDKSVYEAFPLVSYSEARALKAANVTTECAVCLCEFEDEERLRMLPKCGHCFHPECIDAWFQNHTTCPLCRCSLAPALPEPGSEVTTGAFWSSGRFSFRSGSVHRTAPEEQPDGEAAGNGDVVVTIHDQDAIDLERLRAFLRAGSVRGQSGRRVDGGSFRMPAEDSKGAAADTDVKTEEASRPGQEAARPGQAELKRTLSRNSLSFRQAVRGVELQNFLAGVTSLSPKAAASGSPKGGAGAGGSPRGLVSANSLPSEGSPGSRMLRSTSVGRLGSSLRRSGSVGLLGGSMRLNKEDLGGEDLTLLEDSQEFASQSTTLERTSSDRQVVPDSPSQTQKDETPKGL